MLPEIVPEPSVNWRHLPKSPPYTLLAWETCPLMTENPIKDSFDDEMSDMRLPCEPSNPDWLKGVGYAEFEDLDSLFSAPSLSEESLGNRRILVGVAMQMLGIESRDCSYDWARNQYSTRHRLECQSQLATNGFDAALPMRSDQFGDQQVSTSLRFRPWWVWSGIAIGHAWIWIRRITEGSGGYDRHRNDHYFLSRISFWFWFFPPPPV